jgi:hypothetical protein
MGKQRNWTQREYDYLKDNWGTVSVGTICETLNRSKQAIMIKVSRLGLGPFLDSGEYVTFNQMLLALGITSYSYKPTSWIKNKGFPVKMKRVGDCRWRVVYLNDFWKWAEKNRGFVDWSKVEKNILGIEPDWVDEIRKADQKRALAVRQTPWTPEEDQYLKSLLKEFKYTYSEIAARMRRTEGAVTRRILTLGLKERPLKADNHILWTSDELDKLAELLKHHVSYELMSVELGKSSKAIRGKVFSTYLTENIDKAAALIGKGKWGDGRPELTVKHRLLSGEEKRQVKEDMSRFVGILKGLICSHYDSNDYWQREICMKWNGICTAGETDCDSCTSFERIRPQYCKRCGATFLEREKNTFCAACRDARKKSYQRKYMVVNGRRMLKEAQ